MSLILVTSLFVLLNVDVTDKQSLEFDLTPLHDEQLELLPIFLFSVLCKANICP